MFDLVNFVRNFDVVNNISFDLAKNTSFDLVKFDLVIIPNCLLSFHVKQVR
jgi:hypothetical protein